MASRNPAAVIAPIICYVTDRKALETRYPGRAVLECIRIAADAGANLVQVREKDMPASALLRLVREALKNLPAKNTAVRLIINDRLDVAWAAGAGGVHLGRESLPVADVIRWRGEEVKDFRIGASCHTADEVREAQAAGADYVFFGPVFDSPEKRVFGAPQGIARLAALCRAVRIPVIAIGGINAQNAAECLRAGAQGVAAIRMFQDADGADELTNAIARIRGTDLKANG
ncbi:MAG: thiamine phosphate synthase [Candidatus Acidiferrales bacterium]